MATNRKPVRSLKIEQQMAWMKKHFEAAQSPRSGLRLPEEELADQWQILERCNEKLAMAARAAASVPQQKEDDGRLILRGRTYKKRPPLAELFNYIEAGTYPPPELLLTLRDVWRAYMEAGGDMDLEKAFLGKPVQKAGNYAARALRQKKNIGRGLRVDGYMCDGMTKQKAVERLADELGEDVETLKRTVKRMRPRDIHKEGK